MTHSDNAGRKERDAYNFPERSFRFSDRPCMTTCDVAYTPKLQKLEVETVTVPAKA